MDNLDTRLDTLVRDLIWSWYVDRDIHFISTSDRIELRKRIVALIEKEVEDQHAALVAEMNDD